MIYLSALLVSYSALPNADAPWKASALEADRATNMCVYIYTHTYVCT